MATLLHTDGTATELAPRNGQRFTLAELQEVVGGYIEIVLRGRAIPRGSCLVVNEEGMLDGLPVNERASEMAGQTIVGNVLVASYPGEVD